MIYQITMSNKDKFIITEDEYKALLVSKGKGLFFIGSLEVSINRSFIVSIVPGDIAKLPYSLGEPSTITAWLEAKIDKSKAMAIVTHQDARL